MINIEYVCTGNNGRSPMAEAIGRDYVLRNELSDKVRISSSGSGLALATAPKEEALRQQQKSQQQKELVELALRNQLFFSFYQENLAQRAVAEENSHILQHAFDYLLRLEGIYRDQALLEVGLVAEGPFQKATLARDPQQRIILGMTTAHCEQVKKIYSVRNVAPEIVPLHTFVGLPDFLIGLPQEVPNPFCHRLPAYQAARNHLQVTVPKSIDLALKFHGQ